MNSLQILYAKSSEELLDRRSALGSYIFSLASVLGKSGLRVRLNEYEIGGMQPQAKPAATVPGKRRLPIPRFFKLWIKDILAFRYQQQLLEKLKAQPAPSAILEFYSYGSRLGAELAQHWGCPLYVLYDGPIVEEYAFFQHRKPIPFRRVQSAQILTLKQADKIIVYSKPMREYVVNLAGLPDDSHIQIHQNVDFSRLEFDRRKEAMPPINIGFVGSFLPWHRVDLLLEAFSRLKGEGLPVRLLLVGYGMEWEKMKALVDQSPYKADIEMPGFLDGEKLFAIKQRIHVGVMPSSNWYGAPNKLFEYGAMNIACVAPSTPTIADIFTPSEVGMFDNHDGEGLYQALRELCMDPGSVIKQADKMYNRIKTDFGPEKSLAFYQTLMEMQDKVPD
ncbi:MAG: glycosyltransferase [Bacteroidota bacterium]